MNCCHLQLHVSYPSLSRWPYMCTHSRCILCKSYTKLFVFLGYLIVGKVPFLWKILLIFPQQDIWKGHKSSRMLHSVCQKYALVFSVYYRLEFFVKSKVEIPKNVYKLVTCNCWAVKWCKELFSLTSIVWHVLCPTSVIITRKRKVSGMVVSGTGAGPVTSVFQVLVVVVLFGLHQQNNKSCCIKHENPVRSHLFMWGAMFCLLPDMWQWTGSLLTFVAPISCPHAKVLASGYWSRV